MSRTARLADAVVGYQLRRARRRSIGFSVRPDGLVVTAPGWVPLAQIESALAGKAAWILRKLAEARERAIRAERERMVWRDGASLQFRGGRLTLRIDPALGRCGAARLESGGDAIATAAAHPAGAEDAVLRIAVPAHAPPARIQAAVKAFLLVEARRLFEQRLDRFSPLLGVRWRRLSLGNAATRWGSASADGSIRLHWRLIQLDPALLDYVVVHELAHLRHMNHSPRFWALVASVLPGHDELRARLRSLVLPRWE